MFFNMQAINLLKECNIACFTWHGGHKSASWNDIRELEYIIGMGD